MYLILSIYFLLVSFIYVLLIVVSRKVDRDIRNGQEQITKNGKLGVPKECSY